MCVIFACDKKLPSTDTLRKAEETNRDGAGIAWLENNTVRWKKNLSANEIIAMLPSISTPALIHFRLASVGGKSPSLCHPFTITKNPSVALEGQIKGRVLVHNGHWSKWQDVCLQTLIREGGKFPDGLWSDSRAIAWLAARYGTGFLNLIDEKVAVLSTTAGLKTFGRGWEVYEGIIVSNTNFLSSGRYITYDWHKDISTRRIKMDKDDFAR